MSAIDPALADLYGSYLAAWNSRDFARVASLFTKPAMFMLGGDPVAIADADAMTAMLGNLFAKLDADGFSHTEVGELSARICGQGMAVIDARDVRRLRHDGTEIERIDGHYIVHRTTQGWRLAVAVSCNSGWREA